MLQLLSGPLQLVGSLFFLLFLCRKFTVKCGRILFDLFELFPEKDSFIVFHLQIMPEFLQICIVSDGIRLKEIDFVIKLINFLLLGFEFCIGFGQSVVESLNFCLTLLLDLDAHFLGIS
jgi:hypothetical protein